MYIGIDIGGTNTRIGCSQSLDDIRLIGKSVFPTHKTFDKGIFELIKNIKNISTHPKAIGIGIAGRISNDKKEFIRSTNLSAWTKQLSEKEWNIVLSEFKNSIQTLLNKFDVKTAVIGGGIVNKQKDKISKTLDTVSLKILFSKLGEDAGVYGGLAMIKININ